MLACTRKHELGHCQTPYLSAQPVKVHIGLSPHVRQLASLDRKAKLVLNQVHGAFSTHED